MATITLRDVIEVYEEKAKEVLVLVEQVREAADRASTKSEQQTHDFVRAMQRIKQCRAGACRRLASEYEDDYPYRRRQR